ncbi:PhzF family phenazine biosynthesis protein [Parerythrobacter lacustris]|uniref:PhzF family phenazine biosynthesis protein n=1 Tax=Parerythrobacter lacustris TaxID=2969984 RepID=A0ABT1XRU9_9SPHN|nr:PhzF family phenazine biosynthesis protein [Parerythrobacter lacustris]
MKLPYWQVDAFVDGPLSGNPAAVLLLDHPIEDGAMQAVAAETGLPATAFVLPGENDIRPIRWFASDREIALCGHGALAAGHLVLAGADRDEARFRSASGELLTVRRLARQAAYELGLPALVSESHAIDGLAEALGREPVEMLWRDGGYAVAVFADAADVLALAPEASALRALGNWQVTATAPGTGEDVVSRVFSSGGREDAATGSAHALLTPYWTARLGRSSFTARQASARGAKFDCRIEGATVWLGGACRTVIEGSYCPAG